MPEKNRLFLNLKTLSKDRFFISKDQLQALSEEIEQYIELNPNFQTIHFVNQVLFSHELTSDTVISKSSLEELINREENSNNILNKKRKINLYQAYYFILNNPSISKDSLKELYSIISAHLLNPFDEKSMGEYYRTKPVWIAKNNKGNSDFNELTPYDKIDELMESYFSFLHKYPAKTDIEKFIKSQIIHFYLVYIHPYFDANGRASRTLSIWYLLNQKMYSYILFERGVKSNQSLPYCKSIHQSEVSFNLTPFIKLMLQVLKLELEKEYVLETLQKNSTNKITENECKAILTFINSSNNKTAGNLCVAMNDMALTDRKIAREIYEQTVEPLISKDILKIERETNGNIYLFGPKEKVLSLNKKDLNPVMIKSLNI